MKKTNFIKFESNYRKGTYTNYSSQKECDLYVRGKDKDGENEITRVVKVTLGTARIVNYGNIFPIERDNLIKDLCYGLLINESKTNSFTQKYGNSVDLESFETSELQKLVKEYSYFGARNDDPNIRKSSTIRVKEEDSKFLYRDNGGELKVNLMPTRAGKNHKAKTHYLVTEVTPKGETITKVMTKEELDAIGKVIKSSSWNSNRFAQNSPYMQLVEKGIIKNNNGPAESCIFEMKLRNITGFKDIYDPTSE